MRKSFFSTLDHHPNETGRSLADVYQEAHKHAQLADQLGFSCFWSGEHHYLQNVGSVPNPAILLSSLAQYTQNIRLGSAVAVLPMRDPILTAENYAMVDTLSGGRLNFGVGTGQVEEEYQGMGKDFNSRHATFEQSLSTLLEYWSSQSGNYPDTEDSITSLNICPKSLPQESSRPPVYVATVSPEGAYKAGKNGYSILTIVSPASENLTNLQQVISAHAKGKAESCLKCTNTEVVVTVFAHAADTEQQALSTVAQCAPRFMSPLREAPDVESVIKGMISRNTALFGTKEQISAQLNHYRALGVEHINFLGNFGGMTEEQVSQSIGLLSEV